MTDINNADHGAGPMSTSDAGAVCAGMPVAAGAARRLSPSFTAADVRRASDEWGCNCGPGALAAIAGLTLDEVRGRITDFERKGFTNPSMMFAALNSIGDVRWRRLPAASFQPPPWPSWGLARIQWEGPWMRPEVPARARYRYTHWVGAATVSPAEGSVAIFDINAVGHIGDSNGNGNGNGWVWLKDWSGALVPWILRECVPRASGGWHVTHAMEVDRCCAR